MKHHYSIPFDVESLSPQVVLLVVFLVVGSALDALFTLMHMQYGASEANPLMAMALDQGTNTFVVLKMALTGLGALLLAIRQDFRLGVQSLHWLSLGYGGLLVYHLLIFIDRF